MLNPGIAGSQQTGFRAQNAVWIASWTQNLAKSAERALAIDVNLSYQTDRFIESPFADGGPGAGTLGFYFSPIPLQYGFSVLDTRYDVDGNVDPNGVYSKLDCFIRNIGSCAGVIPLNNADSVGAHVPRSVYRSNPYGLQTALFPDGGLSEARLQLYSENRWVANASLDWQLDRYNRIQIGGEYIHYDMVSYSQTSLPRPLQISGRSSRCATRRSSRTAWTSATWLCSSACGMTTSTPGPAVGAVSPAFRPTPRSTPSRRAPIRRCCMSATSRLTTSVRDCRWRSR